MQIQKPVWHPQTRHPFLAHFRHGDGRCSSNPPRRSTHFLFLQTPPFLLRRRTFFTRYHPTSPVLRQNHRGSLDIRRQLKHTNPVESQFLFIHVGIRV